MPLYIYLQLTKHSKGEGLIILATTVHTFIALTALTFCISKYVVILIINILIVIPLQPPACTTNSSTQVDDDLLQLVNSSCQSDYPVPVHVGLQCEPGPSTCYAMSADDTTSTEDKHTSTEASVNTQSVQTEEFTTLLGSKKISSSFRDSITQTESLALSAVTTQTGCPQSSSEQATNQLDHQQ